MQVEAFYVPKKTGTYADSLEALGLAALLGMMADHQRRPRVRDEGWAYAVGWADGEAVRLDELDYEALRFDPGYRYIAKQLPDPDAPAEAACIVYASERQRLLAWRQRRQELIKARAGKLTEEDREELAQMAPMPGWFLIQNLNVLQAFGGYNKLHAAIRSADPAAFQKSVAAKLEALTRADDPALVQTPFAPRVTSVQAFNPSVGKGINRPKPDGTPAAGLPAYFVDWFEEWLRYVGLFLCANSYKVGDHIKVVGMAPGDLDVAVAPQLWQRFVGLRVGATPVHIDVRASLELARILVESSGLLGDGELDPFGIVNRKPNDVVAGLHTAFFSNLGNAYALTNTSFIGLPGWFPVDDSVSAKAWLAILDEHLRILRSLDEERAEEAAMLMRYRDFLSAGSQDLWALFDFWGMYACHALRKGAKAPVPLFTVKNTGRLLMSTAGQYSEIVNNPGFRAIAAAIRRATVTEQFHKAQGRQEYEIHYGLFQDLRQKARFKDQVVAHLSSFIASYNHENARKAEQAARQQGKSSERRHRPQVTLQQLDEVIGLIDRFGSEVVTMLLVAYGSARDPRETPAGAEPAVEEAVEEQESADAVALHNED
jgi:hypothetical protein